MGFGAPPPPLATWKLSELAYVGAHKISKFGGYCRAPLLSSFSDEFCIEEDVGHRPPDEQDVTMVEKSYRRFRVPRKCTREGWGRIQYLSGIYFKLGEPMWKEFQDPSLVHPS